MTRRFDAAVAAAMTAETDGGSMDDVITAALDAADQVEVVERTRIVCTRTEDHLAHRIPAAIRCLGVGPQVCSPVAGHTGRLITVPFTGGLLARCEDCGEEVLKAGVIR